MIFKLKNEFWKDDTTLLSTRHSLDLDTNRLKMKNGKILCKWVGMAILVSDKIVFKSDSVKETKKWHHILIDERIIHQEDKTIVNIYSQKQSPKLYEGTINNWKK